jgi:hypothetical protein
MHENGKMRSSDTIPGSRRGKEENDGGGEFKDLL